MRIALHLDSRKLLNVFAKVPGLHIGQDVGKFVKPAVSMLRRALCDS